MIVDRYYYHQLNKQEQAIYKAFYNGAMAHQDIIPIPVRGEFSQESFERIFMAMTRDNPLIYFLNQSACSTASDMFGHIIIPIPVRGEFSQESFERIFMAMTRDNPLIYFLNQSACSTASDMFGHIAICPQYFFTKEKVKEYNRKIEKVVNELAGQLHLLECNDYEKELRVHDWICQNIEYDYEGTDKDKISRVIASHNILGVFAYHKAQCEGIAKALKVLLNAVNVKCIVVTGDSVKSGQSVPHAWNIVNIGEEPYQLDVTWALKVLLNAVNVKCIVVTGDSVKSGQSVPHAWNIVNIGEEPYQLDVTWDIGAMGQSKHHIAHDYFNLTDELMNQDHKANSSLPECKSKKANYYVQRGCSFQMRHRLMTYIDRLIEKNERIYEFRAEGRLNKVAIEKEVADHIVQKLHEQGRSSVGIKTCSNRELGIYRIEIS